MRPGVPLWAGVAEAPRGRWLPAFVLLFYFSFPLALLGGERETAQKEIPPVVGQNDPW